MKQADRVTALQLPGGITREAAAIHDGSLDLAIGEASQLTVTVSDPSGAVAGAPGVKRGGEVRWAGLRFAITGIAHGPVDGARVTTLTAYSRGWWTLKHAAAFKGPRTWKGLSPSLVVRGEARKAGLSVVAQPTARRKVISRLPKGKRRGRTSSLAMIERLAGESGFVFGEVAGQFVFAAPSWLVKRPGWTISGSGAYLAEYPAMSTVADDPEHPASVSLRILGQQPQRVLLPFQTVRLVDVPRPFTGRYLVNRVTIPLSSEDPGTVELVAAVDPDRQDRS